MQMTYGGGVCEEGQIQVRGSTNVDISHKTTQSFSPYSENIEKVLKLKSC